MCLAIPAKIIELQGEDALIEINGVQRAAKVTFIREPAIGDFVLVHAGFAIQKWSKEDVQEYQAIMEEMNKYA